MNPYQGTYNAPAGYNAPTTGSLVPPPHGQYQFQPVYQQPLSSQMYPSPPQPPPPPSVPADIHEHLWSLCHYYLACARYMSNVQHKFIPGTTSYKAEHYILSAIATAQGVVDTSGGQSAAGAPPLAPYAELRFRCLVADLLLKHTKNTSDAELHIQKASLLASQVDSSGSYKYYTLDLQVRFLELTNSVPAAEKALMAAVKECFESRLVLHGYFFLLRLANLFAKSGNIRQTFNILMYGIKASEQLGNTSVRIYLLLVMTHHCLVLQSTTQSSKLIQDMHKFFTENTPAGTPPVTASMLPVPLHVYYFILSTMDHLRNGDVKAALATLPRLHKLLEQWQPATPQEVMGAFHLPLNTTSYATTLTVGKSVPATPRAGTAVFGADVLHNANLSLASHLQVQWLSKGQLFCLVYFLSALCHKPDAARPTGKAFLLEALKCVQREIDDVGKQPSAHEAFESQRWYSRLKVHMLLHWTDVSLLRGDLDDAEMALLEAVKWAQQLDEWNRFKLHTALRWGMLCQQTGKASEALDYYEACFLEAPSKELKVLMQLHKILIYLGQDYFDKKKVEELLESIRADCEGSLPDSYTAAFRILDSILSAEFIKAKTLLLEAIKICNKICNTQLQALTLAFLGTIFFSTDSEQTEKMLTMSYSISEKSGQKIPMLVTGALLGDLYQQQNARAKFSRQSEINNQTWAAAYQVVNRRFSADL